MKWLQKYGRGKLPFKTGHFENQCIFKSRTCQRSSGIGPNEVGPSLKGSFWTCLTPVLFLLDSKKLTPPSHHDKRIFVKYSMLCKSYCIHICKFFAFLSIKYFENRTKTGPRPQSSPVRDWCSP